MLMPQSPRRPYYNPTGTCPRCGTRRLDPIAEFNAVAKRFDIYICAECGGEEAAPHGLDYLWWATRIYKRAVADMVAETLRG